MTTLCPLYEINQSATAAFFINALAEISDGIQKRLGMKCTRINAEMSQVWYLIVSIPDLCLLPNFDYLCCVAALKSSSTFI